MINKQGHGKIDWTDWTWNPISGCEHGCAYCYMLRMEKRFPWIMKPAFHIDRIKKFKGNRKIKPGDKIFVGSSGDMWGDWVLPCWISDVINTAALKPEFIFQFLTKNPSRYHGWQFAENMWFGTTWDGTDMTMDNIVDLVNSVPDHFIRFVSFEPLLREPTSALPFLSELDWIIIGADSTIGAKKPPHKWADWLIETAFEYSIPVWVKDNYEYHKKIKEFPAKNELADVI